MTKIILYVAISKDGFIADKNGDVGWLDSYQDPKDTVGYHKFLDQVEVIAMGSRSYLQTLSFGEWAWKNKQTYVFTHQDLSSSGSYISFTNLTPKDWLAEIRHLHSASAVWLFGGAELVKSFAKENLIDECVLTITPDYLDQGIKLEFSEKDFDFVKSIECAQGLVQKYYVRNSSFVI